MPQLTHLTLECALSLPSAFLASVPRLTHLTGDAPPFPRALQYVPQLTHVELRWAGQSLASAPRLIHLDLHDLNIPSGIGPWAPALTTIPDAFLADAPRLAYLNLPVRRLASARANPSPCRARRGPSSRGWTASCPCARNRTRRVRWRATPTAATWCASRRGTPRAPGCACAS